MNQLLIGSRKRLRKLVGRKWSKCSGKTDKFMIFMIVMLVVYRGRPTRK